MTPTASRSPAGVHLPVEVVWLVINEPARRPESKPEGAMAGAGKLPGSFFLDPPMPNPFGEGTLVKYGMPKPGVLDLAVFDAVGRRVRTLATGRQAAGRYSLNWNGKDERDRQLANGIYFIRFKAERQVLRRKATLLRR